MTTGSPMTEAIARILFVCADEAEVLSSGQLVQEFGGKAVIGRARNGRDATELLRAERFDAVLLELAGIADLAPQADAAIARLVRLAAEALVIALAPQLSVSAIMAVMGAGAHDYIAYPLQAAALASRIAELADRHGRGAILNAFVPPAPLAVAEIAELPETDSEPASHIRLVTSTRPILPMWRQEQRIIEEAIATFGGNIALAAAALELSPSTIYRKRQAWAMSPDKRGAA